MTLYQELLKISQSMLSMGKQEDWESFYQMEKERELIITRLKQDQHDDNANISDLKELIALHKELEKLARQQKNLMKQSLLGIQKGKKANNFYQR